ncbi:MAG: hypothetical protein A2Z34_01035 [Planctomycetes bacterium RBG_16_59_8]|nr:MAG: hypothetical protein A2Z34_01035 [Planctomycetes bacterium RBG_16_59_8]
MDILWRENKGLILIVAAALVAVYIYHSIVIAPLRAEADLYRAKEATQREEYRQKTADGVPNAGSLSTAERDLKSMEQILEKAKGDILLKVPARFTLPATTKNPKVFFQDTAIAEWKAMEERSLRTRSGVKLPKGFGFPAEVEEAKAREDLARLFIASRLISSAIDAGCESVESIDPLVDSRDGGRDGADPEILSRIRVHIKITGSVASALRFLHTIQRQDDFLAIDKLDFRKAEPSIDRAVVEITVGGVTAIASGKREETESGEKGPTETPSEDWPFGK